MASPGALSALHDWRWRARSGFGENNGGQIFPPKKGPFEEGAKGSRRQSRTPGGSRGRRPAEHHGAPPGRPHRCGVQPAQRRVQAPAALPHARQAPLEARGRRRELGGRARRGEARREGHRRGDRGVDAVQGGAGRRRRDVRRGSADGEWVFAGNDEGELVVVNASSGSVASRTRVLAGSIAAVDAVAVDPPPPPPPRPPTPPPEDTAGEGDEGAEGADAEGADADADGPEEEVEKEKEEEAPRGGRGRRGRRRRPRRARPRRHRRRRRWIIPGGPPHALPRRRRRRRRRRGRRRGGPDRRGRSDRSDRPTPVVAAGDAPVSARRSDETNDGDGTLGTLGTLVATARFSPDGTALAVTCGGGALAVYAIAKPPRRRLSSRRTTTTTTKGEEAKRSGDGEGDDAAQEATRRKAKKTPGRKARKGRAEGEEGVAEGEAGELKSDVDFVAAAAKAPRLTVLTWLPADAAARTFGPFRREGDDGIRSRDLDDPAADEGGANADPRWIRATPGAGARRRSTSDSPAAARTRRSSRGEASIGSRCSSSPARRTRPRGWRWFRRCGGRARGGGGGGGVGLGVGRTARRDSPGGGLDPPVSHLRLRLGRRRRPPRARHDRRLRGSLQRQAGRGGQNVSANRKLRSGPRRLRPDRAASCARRRQLCLGTDGEHAVGDRRALLLDGGGGTRATNDAPARSSPPPKPAGWPPLTSTRRARGRT